MARSYGAASAPRAATGSAERGLLDYLRILWRHKLLIALTVVVTTGAAVGLDHVRHRTYQGTAEVLFTVQGTSAATSATGLTGGPRHRHRAHRERPGAGGGRQNAPHDRTGLYGNRGRYHQCRPDRCAVGQPRLRGSGGKRVRPRLHPGCNPGLHQIHSRPPRNRFRLRSSASQTEAQHDLGHSRFHDFTHASNELQQSRSTAFVLPIGG